MCLYSHTPTRLHCMKLMADYLCWKCKIEAGTFLHCFWECSLIAPFWKKVVTLLKGWSGLEVPLTPELCLLGDRSHIPRIHNNIFTVVMVGLVTASRIILRSYQGLREL
uniref:Reverse transcriptase zinc-binding domain-containing protein n=1 Tax=Astatotilapia calliptera TaxID=8154 RepID=A0A3P8PLM6_ASTCA